MAENKLFSDFTPQTTQEWVDKITKDLKGADFNRKLVWRTNEGFDVQPFYRLENMEGKEYMNIYPGDFPYIRGNRKDNNDWYVRQNIIVDDIKAANEKALDVLNKGIDSIGFDLKGKTISNESLHLLLNDFYIDCIEINFENVGNPVELIQFFIAFAKEKGVAMENVFGGITIDPLSEYSAIGKFNTSEKEAFHTIKEAVEMAKPLPHFKVIGVGGKLFNNSGSSIVEELGFSLAAGVEYLTRLTEAGLTIEELAPKVRFNFATSSKYFMEVAKLRAGRMLWAYIVKAYGAEEAICKMNIHGETSSWNKTIYDPYVNMLRTQTEAMSSIIGGLDSYTINPFNDVYEPTTYFSERIARNQQLLLKEESHFARIADPAGGSYYIEALTESIANEAWKLFLEVQDKGGYLAAFRAGFVQEMIKATAQKRDMSVATRRENFLGTNQFPNFGEVIEKELSPSLFEPTDQSAADAECETLKTYRGAQAFEAMRYKTDVYSKEHGRPKVMMFPMGNLNMRKARAQFACNFFACAGFDVEDHNGFKTVEEGIEFIKEKHAKIVVVCSSDDEYATLAPEIYKALNGSAIFVVAGAPACAEELKEQGITNFIHVKSNVLETLKAYQAQILK